MLLDLLIKLGNAINKALREDKKITYGIEYQPNQKPIALKSFASILLPLFKNEFSHGSPFFLACGQGLAICETPDKIHVRADPKSTTPHLKIPPGLARKAYRGCLRIPD